MRIRSLPLIAAASALTLTLGACGGGDDDTQSEPSTSPSAGATTGESLSRDGTADGTPSSSADPSSSAGSTGGSDAATGGAPEAFDTENQTTFPEIGVADAAMTEDSVLTMTPQMLTARTLPDLEKSFEISADAGRMVDVWARPGDQQALVAQVAEQPKGGTAIGKQTFTVYAVNTADGSVEGTATATLDAEASSRGATGNARIVGVEGDVIVLDTYSAQGADAFSSASARHTTVALDLASGGRAWISRGSVPLAVAGERVVLNTGTTSEAGRLRGVDVESGRGVWAAAPGTGPATLIGVGPDSVSVATGRGEAPRGRIRVIDTADGTVTRTVASPSWNWQCLQAPDGRNLNPVAACNISADGSSVGWNARTGREAWALPTAKRYAPVITAVYESTAYGLLSNGQAVALDLEEGTDTAANIGAAPSVVAAAGGVSLIEGEATFLPAAPAED